MPPSTPNETRDAETVTVVWPRIRAEAQAVAAEEPILEGRLIDRILRHDSLGAAIAHAVAIAVGGDGERERIEEIAASICSERPDVVAAAADDLLATVERDPSCEQILEPLVLYKGYQSLLCHRVAHVLWTRGRRALARHIQARAAETFSIDLHPGARIGRSIFIDHGTGVVVGETAVIEDRVSLLHGVTLGGTGKEAGDRHPKVREGVMIGAGATILGNIEVGAFSKVAAGSVVLRPVPPRCTVAGVPATVVGHPRQDAPALEMEQDIDCSG